jgi:5'-nucleotidase
VLRRTTIAALSVVLAVTACSSDDSSDDAVSATTGAPTSTQPSAEETTTTEGSAPLTIMVTNDDGIGAPGIDAVVTALQALDDVAVIVVAPAENQSGSSDRRTPGGAPYAESATTSGVTGTAVDGFPADTIAVALDELGLEPDLVVSGINEGQNTGPFAFLSGTVGAGRESIRRGVPAIAGSAGLGDLADFDGAARLVVDWVEDNRAALAAGTAAVDAVVSINVPACTAGTMKELLEVDLADAHIEGVDPFSSDCTLEADGPLADDVAAIAVGHATLTLVPAEAPAG